jgi:hypothetical protein
MVSLNELREKEKEFMDKVDSVKLTKENAFAAKQVQGIFAKRHNIERPFEDTLTCLPIMDNCVLEPDWWHYYSDPWQNIFYNVNDPFNDLVEILWGPRGGGKTISGVGINIIDGQMRGIPCISNVPFSWVAKDRRGKYYKVESIPFDVEAFIHGDPTLKYKRLFLDEGNYLADCMRATSNKNMAMTDILQQARKFRMCVTFATINWMWLDHRITGSLCDLLIECNDVYYKSYGRKHGLKKGWRIAWDVQDQSGKLSGKQFSQIAATTFDARIFWNTFDTDNFVNPIEARKRLKSADKVIFDQYGNEITKTEWLKRITGDISQLAQTQTVWDRRDLWEALGVQERGLQSMIGNYLRTIGVDDGGGRLGNGDRKYDLSALLNREVATTMPTP